MIRNRNCILCTRNSNEKICGNCLNRFHAAVDIVFHLWWVKYLKQTCIQKYLNDSTIKNNIKILKEKWIEYKYTDEDVCIFLFYSWYDRIYLSLIFWVKENKMYLNGYMKEDNYII